MNHKAKRFSTHLLVLAMSIMVLGFLGCQEKESWLLQRNPIFDGGDISIPESQISVPIHLPLEQIQDVINQRIPSQLVANKEVKAGVLVTVTRGGALELGGAEHTLDWAVPLKVNVSHKLLGHISTFQLRPVFASTLKPKEDYSLESSTQLNRIEWVNRAVVKVLGSEIDLTPILDGLISDESERITSLIDEQLSKLDLKKILSKTWQKLTNPIRVNKKVQPVYLMVETREVVLRAFYLRNNQLAIDLSVFGKLESVFDSISHVRHNVPFPPLKIDPSHEASTELYLPLVIDYKLINNHLRDLVFGVEFSVEGNELQLDSVDLTSVDSFLLITAKISGDVDAQIEVLGRPFFSPESRELTVNGFDFQVENTSESLLAAGDYFFHDEIIDEVLSKLHIPVGSFIDSIPELIYRGVERGKSGDNINVSTAIDSVTFDQFRVRYDDMRMVLFASGALDVQIEQLKTNKP